MRKKYLSALLFGALLVTSAGTFTSCKDYDDEINDLQGQITDLQTAVKSLEDLVKNGKYVTGVEKTAEGIKFTMNQGEPVIITLDEAGQEGQVFELRGDEIYVDNKPTGIKPAKDPEKAPVKVENGVWMFLNAEGEYESTGIPVSGVSVSGSEEDGFVLEIYDATGGDPKKVEIPTANSLVSSIVFAQEPGGLSEKVITAANGFYTVDGVKHTGYMSELKKDGTRGVSVNVVVTPSNVDPEDLKFSLVNSDGETIFDNAVVSQPNKKLEATRAMDGVYTLTFALKEGTTADDLKKVVDGATNYALAVSCGKATTEFATKYSTSSAVGNVGINTNPLWIKKGDTYSIFGSVYGENPTTSTNSKADDAIITSISGVSSLKLSVDKNYAEAYGVSISEDGTSFTVTKGNNGKVTLDVIYSDNTTTAANGTKKTTVTFNIATDEIVADATLKATHELSTTKKIVYLPVADLVASMTAEEKLAWNDATSVTAKSIENNTLQSTLDITSSKKYGSAASADYLTIADLTFTYHKADKTKLPSGSKMKDVTYLGVEINPENINVTADTYSSLVQFGFTGANLTKNVKGTIEITLTNPAIQYTRIPLYFDGDNLTAYGSVVGNNLEFNVETAYNNGEDAPSFTVENKESKDKWDVINNSSNEKTIIQIPLSKLYTTTQKFEVSYYMFANASNNKVTETIYVKGQSPIKDGEITVSKTELSLATGSDTFKASDIKGVDVFNKTYQILASYTQEVMEGTTVKTKATVGTIDPRIEKVKFVVTDANAGAFEIKATYAKVDADGKLILTTKDATSDLAVNATEGTLVSFSIKLKENAAIANGAKVPFKLTVTDEWNQKFEKEISLTVEK